MIKEAIGKLVLKKDLTEEEIQEVMGEITSRSGSPEQIASFLTALRMKGETVREIAGAARAVRAQIPLIRTDEDAVSLDREEITVERETILRTAGGQTEGTNIFNISTATAFVAAGGGVKVTKHVRKSLFELCGCADVIEALGIHLDLTPTELARCLKEVGICFMHGLLAQNGLQPLLAIREKMGIRTLFNLLDPLINPAGVKIQVIGVYEPRLTEMMANVLQTLGVRKGLVVHGEGTFDEISITGKTKVTEFHGGEMKTYFILPEDFGMEKKRLNEIRGGTQMENAKMIQDILKGEPGARRDVTILNAAATLMIAGKAKDLKEGITLASHSIDSGAALRKLEALKEFTHGERKYLRDEYRMETDQGPRSPFQK